MEHSHWSSQCAHWQVQRCSSWRLSANYAPYSKFSLRASGQHTCRATISLNKHINSQVLKIIIVFNVPFCLQFIVLQTLHDFVHSHDFKVIKN